MNLLNETLKTLHAYNLNSSDVIWVGSDNGIWAIKWSAFELLAAGITVVSGLIIRDNLVVVGES